MMLSLVVFALSLLQPPDPVERVRLLSSPLLRGEPWRAQEGYDALRYDLDLAVSPDSCTLCGTVRMSLRLEASLDTVMVDLSSSVPAASVTLDGRAVPFLHRLDRVLVPVEGRGPGDTLHLVIAYGGKPVPGGFGSFICRNRGGRPQFWTLSQTDYAHTWWPCHDTPADKAFVSMRLSVPYRAADFFVASNGVLESIEEADGGATYQWRELHPIAPYLVSLAGTNYVTIEDSSLSLSGEIVPIVHYVYPEVLELAREDFSLTASMMRAFERRFGPYPFVPEKYGMALAAFGGAMEHQTVTTYGEVLVRGDHRYDWIVAHELAHQWWGDWVTCRTWDHIWLNEGFASFSEALWVEYLGGPEAYRAYMLSQDLLRTTGMEFPGTILNPDATFSITVYDKGSWVMHMLRQMLGEDVFWRALADYGAAHAHATALTEDLQAALETRWGASLEWFFEQWLTREGRPVLALSWERARRFAGDSLTIHIRQVQPGPPYRIPLDVRFIGSARDSVVRCDLDAASYDGGFAMPFWVETWEVDPFKKVLLQVRSGPGAPGETQPPLAFYAPHPNPWSTHLRVGLDLPTALPVQLWVRDLVGRHVWSLPTHHAGPGVVAFMWDGASASGQAPAGLYLLSVRAGTHTRTYPVVRVGRSSSPF